MKSSALNSLKYAGIVTLFQRIGSKKIKLAQFKNSGRQPLFDFFADCLAGDFELAKINCPVKIMLLKEKPVTENGSTQILYESMSDFIYWIKKPEKVYDKSSSTVSTVRYSFIVSRDELKGTTFDHIGLYADPITKGELDRFAAIVSMKSLDPVSLLASSALVLDWELNISNK